MAKSIIITKGELLKELESFADDTPILVKVKVVVESDGDIEKFLMVPLQLTRPIEKAFGKIRLYAE